MVKFDMIFVSYDFVLYDIILYHVECMVWNDNVWYDITILFWYIFKIWYKIDIVSLK